MSEYMSMTKVSLEELREAWLAREIAHAAAKKKYAVAVEKYKEIQDFRWHDIFRKRYSPQKLLRNDTPAFTSYAEHLGNYGLLTANEEALIDGWGRNIHNQVAELIKSGKPEFYVKDNIIIYLNQYK